MKRPITNSDITKLYNSFEKKDMPKSEFRRRIKQLFDPTRMGQDLKDIHNTLKYRKNSGLATKQTIDKALRGN